jgi:ATP-dependent Lon protease
MIKKKKNQSPFDEDSFDGGMPKVTVVTTGISACDLNDEPYVVTPGETIPIMALRNMVLFPDVVLPVTVGRSASLKVAQLSYSKGKSVGVFCQLQSDTEKPEFNDLHHIGVIAKVLKIIELPNGTTTVILQSNGPKVELLNASYCRNGYLKGEVEEVFEETDDDNSPEMSALKDTLKETIEKYVEINQQINGNNSVGATAINMKANQDVGFLTNFFCATSPIPVDDRQKLLEISNMRDRRLYFIEVLEREIQMLKLKQTITERTREDIDRQQREYFLQQQIKNIQDELGNGHDSEIEELRTKGEQKNWDEDIRSFFQNEVDKLERISPTSPDYNVQINYLQTLLQLPWNECTPDNLDIRNAERTLNKDHYGLDKVKERILEHLAVLQLKGDMKSPIICLYGPPGVGKTSLGRSIAAALGRKYVRMSLGGVHDEAEIRGHRKTYIGAMPGRIIKSLIKAESSNPVLILDEIDKLSDDHHGDPSSAMLEVLDPEQNSTFHDNFLDMDYDLSKVMFIATANNIGTIPPPLLDRMELIEVSGYITEEKIEIARKHLIPKELKNTGIDKKDVKFSKQAIEYIIENYTRESGVRELEKKIGKVLRKIALEYARDGVRETHNLKPEDVPTYLGTPEYSRDKYQGNDYAGVVTGLAWTAVGGEILFVETSLSKGKGGKLTLTGNLGDVMKESAMLALEYLKAHSGLLNLPEGIFDNWNIHIHVPEGAIPKDGPSAGITMVTSLASALTQRKVKSNLAMTGEITLRGKVLPVGGIKEKILAAKRAGIKEIILCQENKKNIDDIQPMYLEGLEFHYVNDIKEVLDIALTQERVKDAIDFALPESAQTPNDEKK